MQVNDTRLRGTLQAIRRQMQMAVFSGIAGLGIAFMGLFLVALFRETQRVKIGLLARVLQALGKKHEPNAELLETARGLPDDLDNLVVMTPRKGNDSGRRLAGGARL